MDVVLWGFTVELTTLVCALVLFISGAMNGVLLFRLKTLKKEPQPTYDASKLLRALMQGGAVLKVDVIEPGSFFIRSPREGA